MNDEDRELREVFARLKQEDRARVPMFRAPTRASGPRPRLRPLPVIGIAAAVVLVAITTLVRRDGDPGDSVTISLNLRDVAWTSPTDFLLSTPGSDLMRTVPAMGAPRDWTPLGLPGRDAAPESTRS